MSRDWSGIIRRVRRHRMMTQSDLAAALNVSQGTISRWESGQFEPELRYQTTLRDFLRANRPEMEARLMQSVVRSPFPVGLATLDCALVAGSRRYQSLLGVEIEPGEIYAYPRERLSLPARKLLDREDVKAWIFDVACISFIAGLHLPSGQRLAVRQLWTPFLLDGTRTVVRMDLEPIPGMETDDSLFDGEAPIEIVYLDDL